MIAHMSIKRVLGQFLTGPSRRAKAFERHRQLKEIRRAPPGKDEVLLPLQQEQTRASRFPCPRINLELLCDRLGALRSAKFIHF